MYALTDRLTHSQHSRSALLRCAVLAYWFDNGFSRMLVRGPVHGMQGFWKSQRFKQFWISSCAGLLKKTHDRAESRSSMFTPLEIASPARVISKREPERAGEISPTG
jgi:hypothetical protein